MVVIGTNEAVLIVGEAYHACSQIFSGNIHDAFLYGSYARGDFDNESDVDILMTADVEHEEVDRLRGDIARIASRLSLKYDVTVSITIKPLAQFNQYAEALPYYRNVLREGIRYAV